MTKKTTAYVAITKTSVQSTQTETERLLCKHSVEHFSYMTQLARAVMCFHASQATS